MKWRVSLGMCVNGHAQRLQIGPLAVACQSDGSMYLPVQSMFSATTFLLPRFVMLKDRVGGFVLFHVLEELSDCW